MLETLRARMKELLEQRAALQTDLDKVLEAPTAERRDLNATEAAAFEEKRAAIGKLDADEINPLKERIGQLEQIEARKAEAAKLHQQFGQPEKRASVSVGAEPLTYAPEARHSYFLDLARAQFKHDDQAEARLQRHGREMDVELPVREKRREEKARQELRSISHLPEEFRQNVFERRTNPNRTDGQGGYFVPPIYLIDQYVDYARFGRATANMCQNLTLPGGTDSINLPKISTPTLTGVQTADAAAVTSQDMADSLVTAPVRTIAGQEDVAMQLLDQSPVAFDQIIFQDLLADYAQRLDLQVINGSGSSGQVTGILNVSSINSVTYTDATPTLVEMWPSLAQSASLVAKNRKMPATGMVMIPSIWYWATAALDGSNRPLIVTDSAQNPMALQGGAPVAEDFAGRLSFGLPVYMDGNIPSNLGGGSNETRIIAARWSDLYLWEGTMRTRVLPEILSGTLQVRFQVYNYCAFMGNRRPESISVISGTGLVPTSGY